MTSQLTQLEIQYNQLCKILLNKTSILQPDLLNDLKLHLKSLESLPIMERIYLIDELISASNKHTEIIDKISQESKFKENTISVLRYWSQFV